MDEGAVIQEDVDEGVEVYRRRYHEARKAGFTMVEAQLFADSKADVGVLRKLVKDGCPVDLIRAIVL